MTFSVDYLSLSRFEKMGSRGFHEGIPRTVLEIYRNMQLLLHKDIDLRKVVIPFYKWDATSVELFTLTNQLSGDIVHNPILFDVLWRLPPKSKLVVTVPDVFPILKGDLKSRVWYDVFFKRGLEFTRKRADAVIAISTKTRAELISSGFDKKKISVIGMGIDERFLVDQAKDPSGKKCSAQKDFLIGYVGSFGRNKNLSFAINAFKKLDKKRVTFEIWGKPGYIYDEIVEIAKGEQKIQFKGYLPEDRLVSTYDTFDVFVFPTLYEGFGLPILEAMARGKPVICKKGASVPEEVTRYCYKAEDEDHMAQIIIDLKENGYPAARKKEAMLYARRFTFRRSAQETLDLYRKLMEG